MARRVENQPVQLNRIGIVQRAEPVARRIDGAGKIDRFPHAGIAQGMGELRRRVHGKPAIADLQIGRLRPEPARLQSRQRLPIRQHHVGKGEDDGLCRAGCRILGMGRGGEHGKAERQARQESHWSDP